MRNIVPLILFVAFAIVGCDFQRGRFITTGGKSQALAPIVGCIDIVSGYASKSSNTADIDEQNLLYVVTLRPDVQRHGTGNIAEGSTIDYGKFVTTLKHTWDTSSGTIAVAVQWDRQADAISIGKQKFIREKGNLFIVRCETGGETACQQLASLGPHDGFQEVLQSIRKQLPNDQLITSLTLLK
jgi:hypothetical protein